MRFISTRVHGILDYASGVLMVVVGWLGTDVNGSAFVLLVAGAVVLMAGLMTDYEFGIVRIIPMPVHLGTDVVLGLLLVLSPWIMGFADMVVAPHVLFGTYALVSGLTTATLPRTRTIKGASPADLSAR